MKAVVYTRYGSPDVLQIREHEKPVPGDDELLIKVRAAEVTKSDCELRSFRFPGKVVLAAFANGLRYTETETSDNWEAISQEKLNLWEKKLQSSGRGILSSGAAVSVWGLTVNITAFPSAIP